MNLQKSYRLLIVDCDGTLYFQRPFRIRMAFLLLSRLLSGKITRRQLRMVFAYRKVHEKWQSVYAGEFPVVEGQAVSELQFRETARILNCPKEEVKSAVLETIYHLPLALLSRFTDFHLVEFLEAFRNAGGKVVVYSDYPVVEKLKALNVHADAMYCSLDARIAAMKPDPRGIRLILRDSGIPSSQALMIGDRMKKDGMAAKNAGIDMLILGKTKCSRKASYKKLKALVYEIQGT